MGQLFDAYIFRKTFLPPRPSNLFVLQAFRKWRRSPCATIRKTKFSSRESSRKTSKTKGKTNRSVFDFRLGNYFKRDRFITPRIAMPNERQRNGILPSRTTSPSAHNAWLKATIRTFVSSGSSSKTKRNETRNFLPVDFVGIEVYVCPY